jgi:CTD small phosphatase-like protein 2
MLVDNSPYAYSYQTSNGIPIESWYDDPNDTELLKLIGFLRRVQTSDDVRPIIRNQFKTHELIARARAGKSVPLTAPPF